MYISKINIKNYRNYDDVSIDFNEGINVIIGHNNAGKSNLIRAIALFFDSNMKKQLDIDDFNKNIEIDDLKREAPKISVELIISQSEKEDLMADDLVTVSNWLVKLESPYEAKLTYEYFLDSKLNEKYINEVRDLKSVDEVWKVIKEDFLRFYTYKIWGGEPLNRVIADRESLQKFDFQFLNAMRDVERDMFTGSNTMLKKVLDFFIDYDIKSDSSFTEEVRKEKIKSKKQKFHNDAKNILNQLKDRMDGGTNKILSYSDEIGASFDKSHPGFDGDISESDLYSALKLVVEYGTEMKIPVSHNGLGYNNLIFMALLLAKMQVDSDGEYLGSNAKVFPILAIEEPEAHLHPSMQFQFLKFLKKNIQDKKVRQVFITTHSTHITAAVPLNKMICLYRKGNKIKVAYPGKVFGEDDKSKKYVQRFLDATKSDMLFADKIILVEGIAEQLLLSVFAEYIGYSLEEKHVAVINVGGRYFDYFLKLFNTQSKYAIDRKVACITDRDPERRKLEAEEVESHDTKAEKSDDKKKKNKFVKAYPFEYNVDIDNYKYRQNIFLKDSNKRSENIKIFTQDEVKGKTFEYDLALYNPTLSLLITNSTDNKDELVKLMKLYEENKSLKEFIEKLRDSRENKRICDSIQKLNELNDKNWNEKDKKKAIIASRYLNSVGKGENALELAYVLKENLSEKVTDDDIEFNVPEYIQEAIKWVCE